MLVVRLFDAITDPMMGAVADRTRSKHGRYRPWMLWVAIPYGLLAVAAFVTPNAGMGTKLVYAYISYALLMTAYTAVNMPYSALGGVMTEDSEERGNLQTWRFAMAMVGGFLVTDLDISPGQAAGRRGSAGELPARVPACDDGDGHHRRGLLPRLSSRFTKEYITADPDAARGATHCRMWRPCSPTRSG